MEPLHLLHDPNSETRQPRRAFLRAGLVCLKFKEGRWRWGDPVAEAKNMTTYDDDDFYRPPAPTTAGLMFPARSKLTVRGFTLAMTPAEERWRQIISASQGERETDTALA